MMANEIELEILFEDENIVAINKPIGISSAHENKKSNVSLLELAQKKLNQKLFVVHRLDKEVSGVILFAKNKKTHKELNKLFSSRKIIKSYLAVVHGIVEKDSGIIEMPIKKFASGRMGIDSQKGKPSKTVYHVIKRFKDATLLSVIPHTGRRHQLRVHFYGINHPIVGDLKYGDKKVQMNFPRLMLHASKIEFILNSKHYIIAAATPKNFTDTNFTN
ncbi:RluA family pseudouridine synthase [Melioribacteraceae bacterium 4301-Me]|uniref:RluA family pseudouridine synthase n=1 Tax=Pyranulibacter aquaticus TaxID=3163344 RepID=UPI00359BF9A8